MDSSSVQELHGTATRSFSDVAFTYDDRNPAQLGSATGVTHFVVTSATSWEEYTALVKPPPTGTAHQQAAPHGRSLDEGTSLFKKLCAEEKGDGQQLVAPSLYQADQGSTRSISASGRAKAALDRESTAVEQGMAAAPESLGLESSSFSDVASSFEVSNPTQLSRAMDVPDNVVDSATSLEEYIAPVDPSPTETVHQQVVLQRLGQDGGPFPLDLPLATEKGGSHELGPPGSYHVGTGSTSLPSDTGRTKPALDPESTVAGRGVARVSATRGLESRSVVAGVTWTLISWATVGMAFVVVAWCVIRAARRHMVGLEQPDKGEQARETF